MPVNHAAAEAFVTEKRGQWAELARADRAIRDASRVPSGDLTEDDARTAWGKK